MNRLTSEDGQLYACGNGLLRITKKQTFVKLRIFALGLDGMPYGCSNYPVSSFGKTVFLTREEAEKALNKEE